MNALYVLNRSIITDKQGSSNGMKIGLVIDDSLDSNDGVQQYVRTVGRWLATQGHQVHYLAGQTQSLIPGAYSLSKNIRVRFNGNRFSIPLPASVQKIKTLLNREKYDILHIQMPYSPMLAGKIIKHAPKSTALVGTFHILPFGALQRVGNYVLGFAQTRSLRRFDSVCAVSETARQFASHAYRIAAVTIPNTIDSAAWVNRQTKIHEGRIVFFGRLVPRKGCKEFLNVLAALPPRTLSRLDIIIAGNGPERSELIQLAQQLALQVTFTGYIAEQDKRKLLASADMAVFPSLGGESFGIVLLEAIAAGAGVVIGGDNPGYKAVLGETPACIIDFKNTRQAADHFNSLLGNHQLKTALHKQQQALIKQYDTAVVCKQILTMYDNALLHHRQDMR